MRPISIKIFIKKYIHFLGQNLKKMDVLRKNNIKTVKGFLYLSCLRVAQITMSIAATHFTAHSLSVEQYGQYQYVLNVIGFLTIFTLTESVNTLMQSTARGFYGSFRRILPYPLLFSLIGSFVLLGYSVWYGFQNNNDLMVCFLVAGLLFPLMNGITIWRGVKIGEQKFSSFSLIETITLFLSQGGIILLAVYFEGQYTAIFAWFAIVSASVNVIMTIKVFKKFGARTDAEEGIVHYSLMSSFYTAFPIASNYIDKLLLVYFLSPTALALYVAAERIPELLRSPIVDVASALAPRLAQNDFYSKKLHKFFLLICLLFGIVMMIFAFTLMPYAILLIYGQNYNVSIPYMQALMFAMVVGNLASLQIRFIRSKLDTVHLRNIMVSTSLVRIVLSFILIPAFGISGAIISSLIFKSTQSIIINRVVTKNFMN